MKPKTIGKTILLLLSVLWSIDSQAAERMAWIFEQLSRSPLPTKRGESRTQIGMNLTNYLDTFSVQGSGLLDLGGVEMGAKVSERLFLSVTERGRETKDLSFGKRQLAAVEIARYFVTEKQNYGRLGFEYVTFQPENARWFRIGLVGGVIDTPELPWSIEFQLNYFISQPKGDNLLALSAMTAKVFSLEAHSKLKLGALVSWTQRGRDSTELFKAARVQPDPNLTVPVPNELDYEYMLFSIGPLVEWTSVLGMFRLSLPVRVWIDADVFVRPPGAEIFTAYPVESFPDVSLTWALQF